MKILKMILLTTLISFLTLVLFVFCIFKFVLPPERINLYLEKNITKTVEEQLKKSNVDVEELYNMNYKYTGNESNNLKMLERLIDGKQFKNIKLFNNLKDLNYASLQLFGNINMRMDLLKYRINEWLSNMKIKEE